MKELNLEEILTNTNDLKKEKLVGYVAIVGRPNTGKSTFVNTLIGEKISIISNIPQTTRKKILAIYNDEESQIVFFDTPGIHFSKKEFNTLINNEALNSLKESNLILYFIDSSRLIGEEEKNIEALLEKLDLNVLKVYTKSDLTSKINFEPNQIKISSKNKEGFNNLIEKIKSNLKNGPLLFPEDYYTKQDIYFRINEIIREKVFLHIKEEIPHSVYVQTEEIDENDGILKIASYIYTETDSQKYIIVGKGGSIINKIGMEARLELEEIFGKKVFLALKVKSHKNWKKDKNLIKSFFK